MGRLPNQEQLGAVEQFGQFCQPRHFLPRQVLRAQSATCANQWGAEELVDKGFLFESIQFTYNRQVHDVLNEYRSAMDQNCQRDALRCVLAMSRLGNQLIQQWQPWVKVKKPETKQEADSCVMLAGEFSTLG